MQVEGCRFLSLEEFYTVVDKTHRRTCVAGGQGLISAGGFWNKLL